MARLDLLGQDVWTFALGGDCRWYYESVGIQCREDTVHNVNMEISGKFKSVNL